MKTIIEFSSKELNTKPPKYLTEATLGGEGGLMENCSKFIENEELKGNLKRSTWYRDTSHTFKYR